jgi:hypothetical protein
VRGMSTSTTATHCPSNEGVKAESKKKRPIITMNISTRTRAVPRISPPARRGFFLRVDGMI